MKKLVASWLCVILCVSLNISPLSIIAEAVVDSGMIDRFVSLKNNLVWVAETSGGIQSVFAAGETDPADNGCSCSFSCDAITAVNQLSNGVTLSDIKTSIDTTDKSVNKGVTVIHGDLEQVHSDLNTVNAKLETIHLDLQAIKSTIEKMQHNYRVGHLYSLNNALDNCLWRPYSDEVDYVDDIATVTGQFANVYTGYWDTSVTTLTNSNNIKDDNLRTSRVFEILGYDAIIRSEGIVLLKDAVANGKVTDGAPVKGMSGQNMAFNMTSDGANPNSVIITSLFQETIPEENICWIDAITLLYKALGQEQVTYQSFMSRDKSITPETSPAFQGLANPIPGSDGSYQGYDFYMFLTRGNVISLEQAKAGEAEPKMDVNINYIYWRKALNGGFIPNDKIDSALEPITFSEFFVLATKMMQAYGEPVMNDNELKALLQAYGTHYPIQLGEKIADSWAYLAARGILDVSEYTEGIPSLLYDISNTGYISRDQLLLMCMRIKDKDSRTDFKTIEVVLNLSDVMQEDYYYPVYDMAIANGQFSTEVVYDHEAARCYDYVIQCTPENSLGSVGTPMVYKTPDVKDDNRVPGASYEGMLEFDGQKWYRVSIPKDYTGNAYIAMHLEGGASLIDEKVKFIEIPANTALGGGYFCKCSINSGTKVATVSTDSSSWMSFDNNMEPATAMCTDYLRAGLKDRPTGTAVASNATVVERMAAIVDLWTSPMVVKADPANSGASVSASIAWRTTDSNNKNRTSEFSMFKTKPDDSGDHSGSWGELSDVMFNRSGVSCPDDLKDMPIFEDSANNLDYIYVTENNKPKTQLIEKLVAMTEFLYFGYDHLQVDLSNLLVSNNGTKSLKEGVRGYLSGSPENGWTKTSNTLEHFHRSSSVFSCDQDFAVTSLIFNIPGFGGILGFRNDLNVGVNYPAVTSNSFKTWRASLLDASFPDSMDQAAVAWVETGDLQAVVRCNDLGANPLKYAAGAPNVTNDMVGYAFKGNQQAIDMVMDDLGKDDFLGDLAARGELSGEPISEDWCTTSIMDRQENILISWEDMVKTGFINETRTTEMPKMNPKGSYEFMCGEGRVVVNDNWHTIQIGTTLYDLSYINGKSPKLVYVDEEQNNMLYFDYRCIMGICATEFSVSDSKTFTSSNSLGSGNYVVYDLGSNGASSKIYSEYPVMTYNFPETKEFNNVCASKGYTTTLLGTTVYDGMDFDDMSTVDASGTAQTKKYWEKDLTTESVTRFKLNSYVPTANWICVIDDNGSDPVSGNLYVYYPRTAFADGFMEVDGTFHGPLVEPTHFADMYPNIENDVTDASATISNGESLKSILSNLYGVDWGNFDASPWYIKMTCDAAAHLYEATDGLYYLSRDYVIRRFDISKNTVSDVSAWEFADATTNKKVSSLDAGAMYWVDRVGYVYNMPTLPTIGGDGSFTLEKYLTGEYALPLAVYNKGADPYVVNYNVNYYGAPIKKGTETRQEVWLPYGVVLNPGSSAFPSSSVPFLTLNGKAYKNDNLGEVPGKDDGVVPFPTSRGEGDGAENSIPDGQDYWSEPRFFIPAPTAVYAQFQNGGIKETMTIADVTQYMTSATQLYYGNSLLNFDNGTAVSSDKRFNFVSKDFSSVELPNTTQVYRVFRSTTGKDVLIVDGGNIKQSEGAGTYTVALDDLYTNPMEDWLAGLGAKDLVTMIDEGATWMIVIAFRVIPLIGIILMTILIGLSFICDVKIVQIICEKTIDPIRILTFGNKDINTWRWQKVLFPCILLYLAFALFLNGNVIRIVMWLAKWYGVIMQWAQTL